MAVDSKAGPGAGTVAGPKPGPETGPAGDPIAGPGADPAVDPGTGSGPDPASASPRAARSASVNPGSRSGCGRSDAGVSGSAAAATSGGAPATNSGDAPAAFPPGSAARIPDGPTGTPEAKVPAVGGASSPDSAPGEEGAAPIDGDAASAVSSSGPAIRGRWRTVCSIPARIGRDSGLPNRGGGSGGGTRDGTGPGAEAWVCSWSAAGTGRRRAGDGAAAGTREVLDGHESGRVLYSGRTALGVRSLLPAASSDGPCGSSASARPGAAAAGPRCPAMWLRSRSRAVPAAAAAVVQKPARPVHQSASHTPRPRPMIAAALGPVCCERFLRLKPEPPSLQPESGARVAPPSGRVSQSTAVSW